MFHRTNVIKGVIVAVKIDRNSHYIAKTVGEWARSRELVIKEFRSSS